MPTIQPDDELFISVSSTNPAATADFNLPMTNAAKSDIITQSSSPRVQTYRVDSKGDIVFPVLGTLHVAGMTVEGLRNFLTGRISATVKDPLVTVTLESFKVIVAGKCRLLHQYR